MQIADSRHRCSNGRRPAHEVRDCQCQRHPRSNSARTYSARSGALQVFHVGLGHALKKQKLALHVSHILCNAGTATA